MLKKHVISPPTENVRARPLDVLQFTAKSSVRQSFFFFFTISLEWPVTIFSRGYKLKKDIKRETAQEQQMC